ncbi:MAG: hypothetical protein IPK00_24155 [Deltaproteobacteria bacterium]|nr:hypothetical protein [Deltaproteobacteria bacterium]
MTLVVVRTGTWLYDGSVDMPVDIIGLDYDFWYQIGKADDQLEPGEEPEALSPEGFLYYVRFRLAGDPTEPTWVDSPGRSSVDAAMRDAQGKAPSAISWK